MAIFGAGSVWNHQEIKDRFFNEGRYYIGWEYDEGRDLYDLASLLKAGDIIYLKSNQAGSRTIRVKAIGFVQRSFIHTLLKNKPKLEILEGEDSFYVEVHWVIQTEMPIDIPEGDGKLTNVRNATLYEEFLPYVQEKILERLYQEIGA